MSTPVLSQGRELLYYSITQEPFGSGQSSREDVRNRQCPGTYHSDDLTNPLSETLYLVKQVLLFPSVTYPTLSSGARRFGKGHGV